MTAKPCLCPLVPPSETPDFSLLSYLALSPGEPAEEDPGLPVKVPAGWQLRMAADSTGDGTAKDQK